MTESKNKNKLKIALLFLSVLFILPIITPAFRVASAEEKFITVYSWEDYMEVAPDDEPISVDNDLLYAFEQQTGISVRYQTFATSEEMYNELVKNPYGCDLLCPSEYMIMKMIDEDLIKKFSYPTNWQSYGSPYIKDKFTELGLSFEQDTYAVGFMWGTMGYLYNADAEYFEAEELSNWKSIWNPKFKNRVTIKDSLRDTYIMAVGAVKQDELLQLAQQKKDALITQKQYNEQLTNIFNNTDDETLAEVEKNLKELKSNLNSFEVDGGKNDMLNGTIDINFAWSGDAVYAIEEAEAIGKNFGYIVPEEGSNVWFDGWVMPKNTTKTDYAIEFLNFISSPDSAIRNMNYIGYVSCIADDDVFKNLKTNNEDYQGSYKLDLDYFFGGDDSQDNYVIYTDSEYGKIATQYPDKSIIERCAVMDNFDPQTLFRVNDMWNRVKFITLPLWLIIVSVVILVLGVALIFLYKFKDKLWRYTKKTKKGYKVISKEVI